MFGIGLAVCVLAIRWLFSNTLENAYLALSPVPEGKTAGPMDTLALLWPVVDFAIAVVIAIGATVMKAGDYLYAFVSDRLNKEPAARAVTAKTQTTADDLYQQFVQAAQTAETTTVSRIANQIRKPQAARDLMDAVMAGDFPTAESRLQELKELAEPPAKTSRRAPAKKK